MPKGGLDGAIGAFIPSHRGRSPIGTIIRQVLVNELIQAWAELLRGQLIAVFHGFGLFLGEDLLRHRLRDRPNTARIALPTVEEIIVPTLPTLIETHRILLSRCPSVRRSPGKD